MRYLFTVLYIFTTLPVINPVNLKPFYDQYNLNGSFIISGTGNQGYTVYNESLINTKITPASTFNIITTLIALEDGICSNGETRITWPARNASDTNNNVTLAYAFQHNIDLAFWTLRKKIGKDRMNYWLGKLHYGNSVLPASVDSTNGTDEFWVVSSRLQITPLQQMQLIKDLYSYRLPFSTSSIQKVKTFMYQKDIKGYSIYGKRGSYRLAGGNQYIGWFIGYAENKQHVYFFVNYLTTGNLSHPSIVDAQKNIVYNIFSATHLLK